MTALSYSCGPIRVKIVSDPNSDAHLLRGTLDLFSAPWEEGEVELQLELARPVELPAPSSGSAYLNSARMKVWYTRQGLAALSESGATGLMREDNKYQWTVGIPSGVPDIWTITDLENLMTLILATGWRAQGWTPFHAGLVCRPGGPAAMVCAPSGGGKTTLTLALLRRGWFTLGDDKLLLRKVPHGQAMEARALVHTFNLFPHHQQWFPEIGDISHLPKYSVWTNKRRVPVTQLRHQAPLTNACPTHLIQVVRNDDHNAIKIAPLKSSEILSQLMRQTVIPNHSPTARSILSTVAELAGTLKGLRVEVGKDAYLQPDCLVDLEAALDNQA
jgi:hypothetical protein